MRRPRLVATDLDGTFLSPDGTVSADNAAAVHRAEAAGLPVVFVTGRPPRWLDVVRNLPMAHPIVIASNGALLWDLGDDRALAASPISPEVAHQVVPLLRRALPGITFAVEYGVRFGWEPAYRTVLPKEPDDPRYCTGPIEQLCSEPFVKLLAQHDHLDAEELAARAEHTLGDLVTVTYSSLADGRGLLEISAAGVNKAAMLARYCGALGIDAADVAAFGDMPNDLTMLRWAGLPHIMADAHISLAQLDARRIGTNVESAVGRTIMEWLPG